MTIVVDDVNDERPGFARKSYVTAVETNSKVGSFVAKVTQHMPFIFFIKKGYRYKLNPVNENVLYQWRSQPKNFGGKQFGGAKCVILGEWHYFVWKNASQSTWLYFPKIWGGHGSFGPPWLCLCSVFIDGRHALVKLLLCSERIVSNADECNWSRPWRYSDVSPRELSTDSSWQYEAFTMSTLRHKQAWRRHNNSKVTAQAKRVSWRVSIAQFYYDSVFGSEETDSKLFGSIWKWKGHCFSEGLKILRVLLDFLLHSMKSSR